MRRPTPLVTSFLALVLVTVACRRERPEVPDVPAGPRWALRGDATAFTTVGCTAGNDVVSYRFDWGDGDTSAWTDWLDSGHRARVSHVWERDGVFQVRAQALSSHDLRSEWSEPRTLAVVPLRPGTVKWSYESQEGIWSMPAIGPDGALYFGEGNGIAALNPDGSVRWKRDLGTEVWGPVALAPDGAVCFFAQDGSLGMLELDGAVRWRADTARYESPASPAMQADGSVCIGTNDRRLLEFGPDARVRWSITIDGDMWASPAIGPDRTSYFCTGLGDRAVYAVQPDGGVRWRFQADAHFDAAPAVGADGRIYAMDAWGTLYALAPDGTLAWRTSTGVGSGYCHSVVVGPDDAIFCLSPRGLVEVNSNGRVVWDYVTEGYPYGAPAVAADGSICFLDDCLEGILRAVTPGGGLVWQCRIDGGLTTSPTIGPDATVYVAGEHDDRWVLLAVQGTAPLADSPWPKYKRDIANTGRAGP